MKSRAVATPEGTVSLGAVMRLLGPLLAQSVFAILGMPAAR